MLKEKMTKITKKIRLCEPVSCTTNTYPGQQHIIYHLALRTGI